MTLINRDHVLIALEDLVARKGPEFRYGYERPVRGDGPACRYEDQDAPSCGIGDMLHVSFGATLDTLRAMDRCGSIDGHTTLSTLAGAGLHFTPGAVAAMRGFQREQDARLTYTSALKAARNQKLTALDFPEYVGLSLDDEVEAAPIATRFWTSV